MSTSELRTLGIHLPQLCSDRCFCNLKFASVPCCADREGLAFDESAPGIWAGCLGSAWYRCCRTAHLGDDTVFSRSCGVLGCMHRLASAHPDSSTMTLQSLLWLCITFGLLFLALGVNLGNPSSDQVRQLSTYHCSAARNSAARRTGCFVLTAASFTGAAAICILRHFASCRT